MKVEYCNLLATIATDTTAVDTAIIKTAADLKISWRSYENLARLDDRKNLFIMLMYLVLDKGSIKAYVS